MREEREDLSLLSLNCCVLVAMTAAPNSNIRIKLLSIVSSRSVLYLVSYRYVSFCMSGCMFEGSACNRDAQTGGQTDAITITVTVAIITVIIAIQVDGRLLQLPSAQSGPSE